MGVASVEPSRHESTALREDVARRSLHRARVASEERAQPACGLAHQARRERARQPRASCGRPQEWSSAHDGGQPGRRRRRPLPRRSPRDDAVGPQPSGRRHGTALRRPSVKDSCAELRSCPTTQRRPSLPPILRDGAGRSDSSSRRSARIRRACPRSDRPDLSRVRHHPGHADGSVSGPIGG